MKAKHNPIQIALLSVLGGAGYLTWVLQLLMLVALYFQQLQDSSMGKVVFPAPDESTINRHESTVESSFTLPTSGLFTVFAVFVGLAFIGWAVYLVTMRYIPAVNKTANKVVHVAAEQTVAQTARISHKKLPVRKQRLITARVVWWLKLSISLLPMAIVLLVSASSLVSKQVATLIMAILSLCAVLCFATQAALAKLWRLSTVVE